MFYFHFKPEKSCKALKLICSGTPRAPPFDPPLFAAGTFSVKQAVWFKHVSVKKKSVVCVEAKVCFLHVRVSWSVLRVICVFKTEAYMASDVKDLLFE